MGFSRQEYWSGLPLPSQIQQLILHLIYLEGSGAGGVQTAKASRKQSSLSGKESAQGCIPKRLLAAQTKRWAEGIRVPGPLTGGGSTQRLVWAAKQALGKAALGALFA